MKIIILYLKELLYIRKRRMVRALYVLSFPGISADYKQMYAYFVM